MIVYVSTLLIGLVGQVRTTVLLPPIITHEYVVTVVNDEDDADADDSDSFELTEESHVLLGSADDSADDTKNSAVADADNTVQVEETVDGVAIEYTYTATTLTLYTTAPLNIRSGPSTDFDVVGRYSKGTAVSCTAQCNETGWYQVSFGDGNVGYVSSKYLSETMPVVESTTTNTTTGTETTSSGSSGYTQKTGIIETIGSVSTDFIKQVDTLLNKVDAKYISAFKSSGWHFYISAKDVDDTYAGGKYGSLLGLTVLADKIIYLDYRTAAYTAVIHEFGHFIDCYLGWPSMSDEFTAIYKAESGTFCSVFSYSNGAYSQKELFAEAVDMWYTEKSKLSANCPQIYEFLKNLL